MARETPEQRARREQRELMERLNAERDRRLTVRQQNEMQMRDAPPAPSRTPKTPQGSGPMTIPFGGLAGRAQVVLASRAQTVDNAVNRATGRGKKSP